MGLGHDDRWPAAGRALLAELFAARRPALISGLRPAAEALAQRLSVDLDLPTVALGATLAVRSDQPTGKDIELALDDATVLTRLDTVLWPDLGIDLLALLHQRARIMPIIAVWPGDIARGRATYSEPGRPDHFDRRVADLIVLRPARTTFPDDTPYTVERIAA